MRALVFVFIGFSTFGQDDKVKNSDTKIVEASCGLCNFGLKGKGCELAVRLDDKAYYVDGSSLDDHGDAHSEDGFCRTIRKAEVSGEVKKGRFQATSFNLLPVEEKEK